MRQSRIARLPWLGQVQLLRNSPIAIVDGVPFYPICGAEDDGDNKGKKDDDKGGSNKTGSAGDDDDDDDDDGADDGDDTPPKDPKEYRAWAKNRQLARENAQRRVATKKAKEERDAALAELEQIKQKDMSELQKAQTAAAKAEKARDELQTRVEGMQVELAFLKMPRDKNDWHDPGAALTLLMAEHRDALTLEEDGTVTGLEDAVKALAKKHKFLIKPAGGGNGSNNTGGSFSGGDKNNKQNANTAVERFRL